MLRIEKVSNHHNPFDEIHCPLCEEDKFVSLDHASVWCEECNAQFKVRYTAGDPGYVVDCFTDNVYLRYTKNPELHGESPYFICKTGEDPRDWIIASKRRDIPGLDWCHSVERYVKIVREHRMKDFIQFTKKSEGGKKFHGFEVKFKDMEFLRFVSEDESVRDQNATILKQLVSDYPPAAAHMVILIDEINKHANSFLEGGDWSLIRFGHDSSNELRMTKRVERNTDKK